MRGFREKRQWRALLHSRIALGVLVVLVLFLGKGVFGVGQTAWETYTLRKKQERTLEELEARAAALQAEIDRLSSERGLEEEIRGTFDVAREGEEVMVIIDPKNTKDEADAAQEGGFWPSFLFWR